MIVGKLWDASTAAQQKKAEVILWKMVKNIAVNTKPDITVKTIKLLALLALETTLQTKPKLRQIMKKLKKLKKICKIQEKPKTLI